MKKWNLACMPIILFLIFSLFFIILDSFLWKERIEQERKLFISDSIERIDNRKWIVDTIIQKDSTYFVSAHNKSFLKLKVKYISNKKPTFSINDTIVDLIK